MAPALFLSDNTVRYGSDGSHRIEFGIAEPFIQIKKSLMEDLTNPKTASILFYSYGNGNWAGFGCNNQGSIWVRTGNADDYRNEFVFKNSGFFQANHFQFGLNQNAYITAAESNANVFIYTNGLVLSLPGGYVFAPVQASAFNVASSIRYKENVRPLQESDLSKILDVDIVQFDYKTGEKNQTGVIAEEVFKIIPSVVTLDSDGQPDSVDYSKFVPYLIKMVQMQRAEIEKLKEIVSKN